ncbi:hypothetical protein E9228_002960 [Curtobacterium flaccumfaciens]|uniref:Siphovirus-type tail component C-terminal domain-containing protein n=1 Tax=Curtobacterium salicis TaxID=1779862 RepID=A0ABX0T9W3_9MICO|nr:hypothetical protein [Curtobacterium sp. WW7]NII42302.1 hypothetical protein [Curtobacterium sp. WW7]
MDQDTIDGGAPGSVIAAVIDGNGDVFNVIDGNNGANTPDPSDPPLPPIPGPTDSRVLSLESLDGAVSVVLAGGRSGRVLMPGATGLRLPPVDVVTGTTPGMAGSWLQEVNVLEREVFLPIGLWSDESQAEFFAILDEFQGIVSAWDDVDIGQVGTCRLVARSSKGERVLDVTYKGGMEGEEGGDASGEDWATYGLTFVAVSPYWHAREPVERSYSIVSGEDFLGDGTGTAPWPRSISPSTVVGENMPIPVEGDVPTWTEYEVLGPVPSVTVTYPGTSVDVPGGVPAGQILRLVTDPRARSARLDGAIAWDRITMGATFAPLRPGVNRVSVVLSTAGDGAGLVMRWTPQWKAAW